MKLSQIESKLMAAARTAAPSDHVPYAFEKRIMAKLASVPVASPWSLWGKPLWRAALSCMALTALCGLWSFGSIHLHDSDMSQEFESAVYASMNQHVEDAW